MNGKRGGSDVQTAIVIILCGLAGLALVAALLGRFLTGTRRDITPDQGIIYEDTGGRRT